MGRRKTPISAKYQTLADQLRGEPSCQEKFQHIRHEQPCGHTEKVKPVMESVLLLPLHTNSDLRYCNEEIMQSVDDFPLHERTAFYYPILRVRTRRTRPPAMNSTTRHQRPSRHKLARSQLASPPCFKSIPALPLTSRRISIQVMLEGNVTTKTKRANFGGVLT
jgi:hypothetical protein